MAQGAFQDEHIATATGIDHACLSQGWELVTGLGEGAPPGR